MDPHSTASHTVTMTAWMTTVFTDTPCLLTFLNDGGRMPSCAVSSSARDGPTIHAEISMCCTKMARNASITPNDRLPSRTDAGSVVATAKPPSASSAMVRIASTIMASG